MRELLEQLLIEATRNLPTGVTPKHITATIPCNGNSPVVLVTLNPIYIPIESIAKSRY